MGLYKSMPLAALDLIILKNKKLIIIDVQNDFITGSLGTEEARRMLSRLIDKAACFSGEILMTPVQPASCFVLLFDYNLAAFHYIQSSFVFFGRNTRTAGSIYEYRKFWQSGFYHQCIWNHTDNAGFAIFAGLEQVLDYLENLHFDEADIEYLRSLNSFNEDLFYHQCIWNHTNVRAYPNQFHGIQKTILISFFQIVMDLYEMTMANGYFKDVGANDPVTFDVFYRKNPDNAGCTVAVPTAPPMYAALAP